MFEVKYFDLEQIVFARGFADVGSIWLPGRPF